MLSIEEFPPDIHKKVTHYELTKDQILFQQGETTQNIFWVQSGRLKLVSFTEEQMITHYSVEKGESFAETALYFDYYGCTAIAEQASSVIAISKQVFLEALHHNPQLSQQYLTHLTHRFSSVKQLLELRSIRSARNRLLQYLSYQRQPGQLTVPLKKSLKGLAMELGLSPEALSRTFSQLESAGVLTRRKGSITFSEEWVDS